MEIGRLCIKTTGREAGKICCIVDKLDEKTVIVDGNVKRRKCNINHLEPLDNVLSIKKGESTNEVHKAMLKAGLKIISKKKVKRTIKQTKKQQEQKTNIIKKKTKVKNEKVSKKGN